MLISQIRGAFAVEKQPACMNVNSEMNPLPLPPISTADDRPSGANYVPDPCLNIQLDKPGQTMMFHGLLQNKQCRIMLDTGATRTYIDADWAHNNLS